MPESGNDHVIEQLVQAMYSKSSSLQSNQTVIRNFRECAGFAKGLGIENDKWLSTISVDDTLNAFLSAFTLADPANFEQINTFNLKVYKDLFLLKISSIPNSLRKSMDFIFKKQCEVELDGFYSNLFDKMNQGLLLTTPEFFLAVTSTNNKMLDFCYKNFKLSQPKEENHWLITICHQNLESYSMLCDYIIKTDPVYMGNFVSHCRKKGSLLKLYSGVEQPIVLLVESSNLIFNAKDLVKCNVLTVLKKLSEIVDAQPTSVVRLFNHFPCLGEWVVQCAEESDVGKKLCWKIMQL